MLKIVFCTDGIFPHTVGGMQRHSKLLIDELVKDPEIQLIVIHPHSEKVFNNSKILEIQLKGINKSNNYLLECYKYSRRVYLEVNKHRDALVYSQGLSIWYKCSYLTDRLIVNPHGLEPYQTTGFQNRLKAIPFKLIFNYIFSSSKRVISLGGSLSTILKKNIKDHTKIIEISNAVNCQEVVLSSEKKSNVCNVLFVGRFASNKGINILADAIQQLHSQGFNNHFKFTLAGMGPLYDKFLFLKSFGNVEFLGFVNDNDLRQLYEDADLFVLPTLFEGMPTVVLEAMSFGLPIIVTDVGATKVIVDDSNGKVIRRGSVDDLCSALLWFENLDADEKNRLKASSFKKIAEKFNWQVVASEHKKLFRRL